MFRTVPVKGKRQLVLQSKLIDLITQFNNGDGVSIQLKRIIGVILEKVSRTDELVRRNLDLKELVESQIAENARLRKEIAALKNSNMGLDEVPPPQCDALKSSNNMISRVDCDYSQRQEMSRSVVISGISEFGGTFSSAHVSHDFDCVRKILDFFCSR
ncbi:unnamed protein product [Nippostrongylus brasiliensis]|uniref:Kinesin motor domain-containing protein n=1 Tax=Nippostrongylus brasiliensis TaxID=27835 RepID=A0A0N4YYM2_NIPBR|nr:unnamed protein product [Nippostrongylus brasiliensis]